MAIRVLIASDHPLTRTRLRQILKATTGFEVVAEAESAGTVAELCRRFRPDVVLFEITAGGDSGPRAIVKAAAPARAVAVASNENVYYARALLAAGVAAYLLPRAAPEDLGLAIRHAACGQRYLDPRLSSGVTEVLLQGGRARARPRQGGLSRREMQVLRALVRGFASHEIGGELQLSAKTVETCRSRIQEKLGLRKRLDLVQYALAVGLLQEE